MSVLHIRRPPTPLDGTYCNALLLVHWSVRQKLNSDSSVQLRHAVRALIFSSRSNCMAKNATIGYSTDASKAAL